MPGERTALVLHEGWGRAVGLGPVVERLAGLGFRVEAPDLFDGRRPSQALPGCLRQLRTASGPMFDRVAGHVDRLGDRSLVMGLSLGAAVALRVRTSVPVVAAYGSVPADIGPTGPLLGIYGRGDPFMRRSGRRLERAGAPVSWIEGAGHSFLLEDRLPIALPGFGGTGQARRAAWAAVEQLAADQVVGEGS